MARRKYGHGTIFQRSDGRWVGRLPDGRGGHRYVTRADGPGLNVLDETGGDLLAAKEMARHESITTTIDRYAQHAQQAREKAAAAVDRAQERRKAR